MFKYTKLLKEYEELRKNYIHDLIELIKFEKLKERIYGDCRYCKYYDEYKLDKKCQECNRHNITDDTISDLWELMDL